MLFALVPEAHAGVASEERLWPRSVMTPKQLLLVPPERMVFTISNVPPKFATEPPRLLPLVPRKAGLQARQEPKPATALLLSSVRWMARR